jgi:5,10-methylenetetrahydromethanopterin reductase
VTLGILMAGLSDPYALSDLAVKAEKLGFSDVWIADERFYREVYSLLTLIATKTEKINIGPCVTDPYSRHPALTAMAIHTLDDISRGRAILGLGAGVSGFAEMGVERAKPAKAIREAIELIRKLSTGEETTYEGEIVKFKAGKLGFKPSRTDLPIWVASNGPLGQDMAGAHADAIIMEGCGNAEEAAALRQRIDRAAVKAGRDPKSVKCIARLNLAISDDGAEAVDALRLRTARTLASGRTHFETLARQGLVLSEEVKAKVAHVAYNAGAAPYEIIKSDVTDAMVRAISLCGTPAEIRDQLEGLFAAGINGVIVSIIPAKGYDVPQTMVRFTTEVWLAVKGNLK